MSKRNKWGAKALSHGMPRVDDQRVISGIVFVIRNGLRWRAAPRDYGPPKTIYNRFVRWRRLGVFNKIFAALAAEGGKPDRLMFGKLKDWRRIHPRYNRCAHTFF